MDDGANADRVVDADMSPIGSPDQITTKQLWRGREPHSDEEADDTGDVSDNAKCHNGSPRWLPRSQRGFRKIKPLALDANLPPPFLCPPGYPSMAEGTPSTLSNASIYFDSDDEGLLPPTKVDDTLWFHHYPNQSIYDSSELDGTHVWDLQCNFAALWNEGDDSDASEPLDSSPIGESASLPSKLELGLRQFDSSEPGAFVLDFPEDVGELLDHYTVPVEGGSGVIGWLGRSTPASASEITIELSVHEPEDSQDLPDYAPNMLLPRMGEPSEDSDEPEPFSHLPYPGSDVTDVPINVSPPPLMLVTDGFPDNTSPSHLGLVCIGGEGISTQVGWLEASWEEIICSPCSEEDLTEWDRWRGRLVEEYDRDLDSRVRAHERVRRGLERF